MVWATADTDTFNRTHVSNTAQTLEQHRHGLNDGLSVIRLNTATALTNPGDVFINSAVFTYRDNQGTPANHSLPTLDTTNTYAAAAINDFSGQTGDNSFKIPVKAGANPTQNGSLAYDSTANILYAGINGTKFQIGPPFIPTGSEMGYAAGTTDPTGWFLEDGRVVSQTTYAALFAVIGTNYNTSGEGAGNFRIPDRRSRIMMGADDMGTAQGAASRTSTNNALGNTSGEDTHLLTGAESGLQQHHHIETVTSGVAGLTVDVATVSDGAVAQNAGINTADTGPTNASSAHNNRQLNQISNFIIKT